MVERTFYSKCKELTFLVKAKPTFASFTIANELLLLPLQYRAFTALAIAIAEAPFCSSTAMYCQKGCYIYTSWIGIFHQDGQDYRDLFYKIKTIAIGSFCQESLSGAVYLLYRFD